MTSPYPVGLIVRAPENRIGEIVRVFPEYKNGPMYHVNIKDVELPYIHKK